MSKLKVQMEKFQESGETRSERELYFFDNHSQATSGEKPSSGLKAASKLESQKKYV